MFFAHTHTYIHACARVCVCLFYICQSFWPDKKTLTCCKCPHLIISIAFYPSHTRTYICTYEHMYLRIRFRLKVRELFLRWPALWSARRDYLTPPWHSFKACSQNKSDINDRYASKKCLLHGSKQQLTVFLFVCSCACMCSILVADNIYEFFLLCASCCSAVFYHVWESFYTIILLLLLFNNCFL